jgi:Tfp pilus assembly protein PilF
MPNISETAKALFDRACKEINNGALDLAVNTFTACIRMIPKEAGPYRGRASTYFQMRHWKAAQADFQRARELDREDPENWVGLGMSLAMDLQILQGINVIGDYLEKHPDYVRAHMLMGLLYLRMGVSHKAKECLEQALALDPTWEEQRLIDSLLNELTMLKVKGGNV